MAAGKDRFVPLFNGKELNEWEVSFGPENAAWTFEDGVLVVKSKNPGASCFGTKRVYKGNLHLRSRDDARRRRGCRSSRLLDAVSAGEYVLQDQDQRS